MKEAHFVLVGLCSFLVNATYLDNQYLLLLRVIILTQNASKVSKTDTYICGKNSFSVIYSNVPVMISFIVLWCLLMIHYLLLLLGDIRAGVAVEKV